MTLFEPYNLPFAAALGLMLAVAIAQVVGLGDLLSGDADVDLDMGAEVHPDTAISAGAFDGLLTLLGIGRVPLMIWLATFLLAFAALGLGIQELADNLTGAPLYSWVAALFAGGAALPVTGLFTRPLGAIIPHDESSAVSTSSLIGRRATITVGTARRASPARAQVKDVHGQSHYVMVEPHDDTGELPAGEEVLLVRREGLTFYAATLREHRLSPAD